MSDIDDAPIVTADDNKQLNSVNDAKKARLKQAKSSLAERYSDIRQLAPLVEQGACTKTRYHAPYSYVGIGVARLQQSLDADHEGHHIVP